MSQLDLKKVADILINKREEWVGANKKKSADYYELIGIPQSQYDRMESADADEDSVRKFVSHMRKRGFTIALPGEPQTAEETQPDWALSLDFEGLAHSIYGQLEPVLNLESIARHEQTIEHIVSAVLDRRAQFLDSAERESITRYIAKALIEKIQSKNLKGMGRFALQAAYDKYREELERRGMPHQFYAYEGLTHYFATTADSATTQRMFQDALDCLGGYLAGE